MGNYLQRPVTAKSNASGELGAGGGVRYAAASMQGYRSSMEDRHVLLDRLGDGPLAAWAMFAVLDGHAGVDAAQSTSSLLPFLLRSLAQPLPGPATATATCVAPQSAWRSPTPEPSQSHTRHKSQSPSSSSGRRSESKKRDWNMENERLRGAIVKAFRDADNSLRAEHEDAGSAFKDSSGCTVCALLLSDERLVFANCGDSRAILVRNHTAEFCTEDHKPCNANERQRM